MRNDRHAFWKKAARSLPRSVQPRYAGYFEQAERVELTLDGLIELGSRLGRAFHALRSA